MSKRVRFFLLIILIGLSLLSLYPTIRWYFLLPESEKNLAQRSRESIRNYSFKEAEKDSKSIISMTEEGAKDEFKAQQFSTGGIAFVWKEAQKRAKEANKTLQKNSTIEKTLSQYTNKTDVFNTLVSFYREKIIMLKEQKARIITLGLDISGGISVTLQVDKKDLAERLGKSTPSAQDLSDAIERAILVLQSRIDRFGVSEPKIRKQNNDSILIEIPGDNDTERINSFIKGKGTMAFRIVDGDATDELIRLQESNPSWVYNPNESLDFIPAGTEVVEYVTRDEFGLDKHVRWIAIYQDSDVYGINGENLEKAQVTSDPLTNQPMVNFQMNSVGAEKLAKITGDYLGQSMAILLGDKIRAYARLSAVISNGQAVIQGFSLEEASNIATILQTAVLPVTLTIVNQQVVGPTLGKTVIEAGLKAILVGIILVIVFMILYYKGAGVVSIVALAFNMLFLAAVLASFSFTITLTGIAGIILTVGMAVDANVLIYERIKEELLLGRSRAVAIQAGFKKAFLTIVDANTTTFIAAFFIAQIASGPIQGFAVTLSSGIITTLISALFVSRLFFDFFTDVFKIKRISITWRRYNNE